MSNHLNILRKARQDVDSMFDWIAKLSPSGANSWYTAFQRAVSKLLDNPTGYGLAIEDDLVDHEVRQFLFKTRRGRTYRGVFTIVEEELCSESEGRVSAT